MNKKTVFTIVFAAVVAIAIAVTAVVLINKEKKEQQSTTVPAAAYTFIDEEYRAAATQLDVKLYGTHIDGLFYSLSPVQYYYAQGGKLAQLKAQGTLSVSPVVANTQMDFDIDYIELEGKTFGVGLWHSDGGVYNDVFALLLDMPTAFNSAQEYLLLLDPAQKDLGADKRLYSELLAVSGDGERVNYLFNQGNRMTEPSGKLRTDWDCATAAMLTAQEGSALTFSGKKYNHSDEAQLYDLQCTEGGNTSVVAQGVCGAYAAQKEEAFFYVEQSDADWALYSGNAQESKKLASYQGSIASDCTVAGNYALKHSDGALIHLQSGKETPLPTAFKKLYAGVALGKRAVYIGKEENKEGKDYKVQKIVISNTEKTQSKVWYANDIMDEDSPLLLCAQGIVTQKGEKSIFISYKSLESLAADVVK
ncbi:MAG: hypothetical protein IJI67_05400 [Clostridia bacterium]|nr:hypothetical protein [Clostridia bacterium]